MVRKLADSSGGSIRDLMRLIGYAALAASALSKETIDDDSARRATHKMRTDYESLLVPAGSYMPLMARIHQTKTDGGPGRDDARPREGRKLPRLLQPIADQRLGPRLQRQ